MRSWETWSTEKWRGGKGRKWGISQDKSSLWEDLQDTAKRRVYTEVASGIQMQRHIQFILLLLLFSLQHKLLWLDGEINIYQGHCAETIQSFCVKSKPECLPEKGSLWVESWAAFQPTPSPQPSTLTYCTACIILASRLGSWVKD